MLLMRPFGRCCKRFCRFFPLRMWIFSSANTGCAPSETERRFTAQEMRRAVDALTPDEHAELFTIYALPHDAPDTPPSSCEDFCARGFTMAFYAYDGDGYALLAQSEEQVEAVIKTLRKAVEIRSVEAVERETLARWAF